MKGVVAYRDIWVSSKLLQRARVMDALAVCGADSEANLSFVAQSRLNHTIG